MSLDNPGIIIPEASLGALALRAGLVPGTISPLSSFMETDVGERAIGALNGGECLEKSGEIRPDVLQAIRLLASPASASQIRVSGAGKFFEVSIFFGKEGDTCALTSTNDGLLLTSPAPMDVVLVGLRDQVGHSHLASIPWEWDWPIVEAIAAMALVDLQRKRLLGSLAGMGEEQVKPHTFEEIHQHLASNEINAQWLTDILSIRIPQGIRLSAEDLRGALTKLVGRGMVSEKEGGYFVGGELDFMASRFPVVKQIVHLDAMRAANDGRSVKIGITAVQDGPSDLVTMENSTGKIRMEGVSSAAFLDVCQHFFSDPDILKTLCDQLPPIPTAAKSDQLPTVMGSVENLAGMDETKVIEDATSPPILKVMNGEFFGKRLEIADGARLGRHPDCELVLAEAGISRFHAVFHLTPKGWTLEDSGSANGTFVNDQKVEGSVTLEEGDKIRFHQTDVIFTLQG